LNKCTEDSCESDVGCINITISCDDNDETTVDYCDPASGCLHAEQKNWILG